MFDSPENLAWLILLLPLAAAIIIAMFTRDKPAVSAQISVGAVVVSFLATAGLYLYFRSTGETGLPVTRIRWLEIGDFRVNLGLKLDFLSFMMALIVTGVGSLIHIFSMGYLKGDRAYSRYFACLSLFVFSMLGIVLADNFLMLFIFWELVGVSSYLLIGFWYEKPSAADACKKAFLTNRIGDFGFLLGILMVWSSFKSLAFDEIRLGLKTYLEHFPVSAHGVLQNGQHFFGLPVFLVMGLLIFCGAVGKSAQFPLHVWLPDAMEGPTPVSALIHAATMVAAGVYMLCRVFFIIEPSGALPVIGWVGGFTALFAAVIAIQQNDIKRILAYSTLSQLGYMVMAVGLGGPTVAMYHLTTHAFFKALLFLAAGSVIYGLHHEQDIWKMGAVRKKMPVTYWTFLAGTLALCGLWPFSGFYSKDGILGQALLVKNYPLFTLGAFVALLTTFYMSRLVIVVFFGGEKSHAASHAHESPGIMAWPLRFLAVLSIVGGWLGFEEIFARQFGPEKAVEAAGLWSRIIEPFMAQPLGAIAGLAAVALGFFMALVIYRRAETDPLPAKLGAPSRAMQNRFYVDEFYEGVLIPCTQGLLSVIADFVDRWIISIFAVRGVSGTTNLIGRGLRMMQDGSLQTYAFLFAASVAVVLYFVIGK